MKCLTIKIKLNETALFESEYPDACIKIFMNFKVQCAAGFIRIAK